MVMENNSIITDNIFMLGNLKTTKKMDLVKSIGMEKYNSKEYL